MALSDLQVFQEEAYGSMVETLNVNIALFNEATMGGLQLAGADHSGDFNTTTFWKRTPGLIRARDPYTKDGSIPTKELQMGTIVSVRYASGTPELRMDQAWMNWIGKDPVEAGVVFGTQLAEQRLEDQLNVAMGAFLGAIKNEGSMVYDHSGATENGGKACLEAMLRGAAKFGDQASDVMCWVMHSKSSVDIYSQAIANAQNLFKFGNVIIQTDAQGRPIIISDAAPLYIVGADATEGTADDRYHLCGLTSGAVVLETNADFNQNTDTRNGNENIKSTYQAEWSEQIGVKGFTWDTTNGGKNPTRLKLSTGTNWDKVAASKKDLAGCVVVTK